MACLHSSAQPDEHTQFAVRGLIFQIALERTVKYGSLTETREKGFQETGVFPL